MEERHMFSITQNKGFSLTFANGITISIQWGPMNYCANKDISFTALNATQVGHPVPASPTAEIALWDSKRRWITKRANRALKRPAITDDVIGYLKPEEVARFIAWAARQKTK
jgi:hypothetical protein